MKAYQLRIGFMLIFYFLHINIQAQANFEKGYFIDNQGNRQECLIRNNDWPNNPEKFQFQYINGGQTLSTSLESVQEFGVPKQFRYVRMNVTLDRRSTSSDGSYQEGKFETEPLFLKTLVEGQASLYVYKQGDLVQFYFSVSGQPLQALIYRKYVRIVDKVSVTGLKLAEKIEQDLTYRWQLWAKVHCEGMALSTIDTTRYTEEDLIAYFVQYNQCIGGMMVNYADYKPDKDLFNLSIRPGWSLASLNVSDTDDYIDIDFAGSQTFRLGIEAEFFFPFNNNKWAFTIEPNYQSYRANWIRKSQDTVYQQQRITANYHSIEVPIGFRYYMYSKAPNRWFIDLVGNLNFAINSKIDFEISNDLKIIPNPNLGAGLGFAHKNYSIQIRGSINRDVLRNYFFLKSNFRSLSVIAGYKF